MVICKFFLQGTCKFGDNCKFEHQMNDHNYGTSSVLLRQTYPSKPQPTSNVDTNTLVKAVVNDMTSAEKGGQWLLSSYAPFKEKPAFPGFEDHCMEEIRHLFYESVKTGSIDQYKQNLQMMLQQAMMKIKALQNPSPEAVNMLKTIYDTSPSSANTQSPFSSSNPSVFGGPQTQTQTQNVFRNTTNTNQGVFGGGTTPQQSVFGGGNSNPIFGGGQPPSGSVFGGQQNQNKSIFGGAPQATNSAFGGAPQATNSAFGGPPQATNSGFGGAPQATNSVFGGAPQAANSVFGGAPQAANSVFGGAPVFAGGTQPSVFAKQPTQPSPFGQNQPPFTQQPNVFQQSVNSQVAATPNQFGAPPNATFSNTQGTFVVPQSNFGVAQPTVQAVAPTVQNKPAFQHTQSIFGNLGLQGANNANAFGNTLQSKPNENYYSKLEDLTQEEIKWFQSDDSDLLKIPEKPPTYEMCFNVH